jgi:hypothetical protein
MDEDYLQALMAYLQQQGGGQYMPPSYGEDYFFVPKGAKVPTYRTQYTPYLSDGNVPLSQALPDQNKFSPDALFDLDPALKPIIESAVSQGGHDPYSVGALLDQPQYQLALIQQALKANGFKPINEADYVSQDRYGRTVYPNAEDVYADLAAREDEMGDVPYTVPDIISGSYRGDAQRVKKVKSSDLAREKVDQYRQALDDFLTQGAPSMERNINNIDYAWTRLGGMPYQGINSGALDYEGSSDAFPTATQTLSRGGGDRYGRPAPKPKGSWSQRLKASAKRK